MRSAAAEPGRQRQRRPQIAHNDTRVKAGHHHHVVRRLQPQTTSSCSVALAALAVVAQRLHQHLGALPTLATSSQPGTLYELSVIDCDARIHAMGSAGVSWG